MSIVSIRKALQTRLSELSPPMPIAQENSKFTPKGKTNPFLRVSLLPAPSDNPTFGSTPQTLETGIFQVSIYWPLGAGTYPPGEKAELIRALFPRGLTLTEGTVTVKIEKTPDIAPGYDDKGWYVVPVSIHYFSHIQ